MAPSMYHRSEVIAWQVKPRNLAREREVEDAARREALMRGCKHKFPGLPVWLPGNFVTEFEKTDMSVPPVVVARGEGVHFLLNQGCIPMEYCIVRYFHCI